MWCLVVNSYLLYGLFVWGVCLVLYAGICAVRQFFSGCARYKSRYMLAWSVKGKGVVVLVFVCRNVSFWWCFLS